MEKIIIEDGDYCKGCELVDKYNELIEKDSLLIDNNLETIVNLKNKIKELREELEEEKNINEKNLYYIDNREKYWQEQRDIKQERIDKAIEYIEWQEKNPQYDNVWRTWECKSLIKILKGDNNE